ncbi:MAG: DegT/DnrJ/EryC1/StrS family aminotransferase [Planctomycetes bacterium]|nr:DegT/DnrJ/EryC1/StrS family aminotransferase [Planctomycetota bacterium]
MSTPPVAPSMGRRAAPTPAVAPCDAPAPIPFHRTVIEDDAIAAITATLRSGWLTSGPRARELEAGLAELLGRRHAVALNSATSALFLACKAAGVGPGDEVLVPAITFMATAEVALHLGARPVIVDVDDATLLIDPVDLERKLTRRARLIAPVHFAGQPCAMRQLRSLAAAERLAIVEDAAHCLTGSAAGDEAAPGADRWRPGDGTLAAALSFYATKELPIGEGGALVSDDDGVIERARRWSLHGISRPAHARMQVGARATYDVEDVGYKMNLPDVLATLGVAQLPRMAAHRARRAALAARYDAALADVPGIRPLPTRPGFASAHHLYVVRVDPAAAGLDRDQLAAQLGARGIGTSVHFTPLHEMTALKSLLGTRSADCPVAARAGREVLSLPLHPALTDADCDRVSRELRLIVAEHAP